MKQNQEGKGNKQELKIKEKHQRCALVCPSEVTISGSYHKDTPRSKQWQECVLLKVALPRILEGCVTTHPRS